MDEASLTERMAQGDQEALAEFIELKQGPLHAFIDRNLGVALRRRVEPLDVFQEVSVECLRSLDSVDFGGKDPFGWLCQVAERKIIDLY
ncbi:MAG: RNA polymerase subunit sigma, partial [Planctomycetota bacterium]